MADLLPCPFCNAEAPDVHLSPLTGVVFCEGCGAEGPWSPFFDGDWNTRALPAASPADHSAPARSSDAFLPSSDGICTTEAGAGDGVEAPAHAEPVAWQWRYRIADGEWNPWQDGRKPDLRYGGGASYQMEERRLFAHPPTDAAEIERLRAENDMLQGMVRGEWVLQESVWKNRAEKAEAERQMLAEAICGGDDFPGLLASTPVEVVVDIARRQNGDLIDMIDARIMAERERDEARAALTARAGHWRVFASVFPGQWGIEVDGDNDAYPVLGPLRVDRNILDVIVSAHNAALSESRAAEEGAMMILTQTIAERDAARKALSDSQALLAMTVFCTDCENTTIRTKDDRCGVCGSGRIMTGKDAQAALEARINAAKEEGRIAGLREAMEAFPDDLPFVAMLLTGVRKTILAKIKEAE